MILSWVRPHLSWVSVALRLAIAPEDLLSIADSESALSYQAKYYYLCYIAAVALSWRNK